jgi:integrase
VAENEGRTRRPNGASSIYLGKDGKWHGRVTVGVKDDGKPDRRHVERKTEAACIKAVRSLEKQRDSGKVRKPGKRWTVGAWLEHWVENIAEPLVSVNTIAGYRVAVRVHLTPGLGAHRLDKLEPEHIERFYKKMRAAGSKPATVHQTHRTLRTALNVAVLRRHITENPARLAKAPTPNEEEVEPYTLEEIGRLLEAAAGRRHPVRWYLALALGLRQGEALGLKWSDVDLTNGILRVRRSRLRPKYAHGCGGTCGKAHAGYCPERKPIRPATKDTKSRAGNRPIGLPPQIIVLLEKHRATQDGARKAARQLWTVVREDDGWVFTDALGQPINPRFDYDEWKRLVKDAKVPDGRLHDARHTAATVLLLLGISDTAVDKVMGWEPGGAMRRRYQHATDPVLQSIAQKLSSTLWAAPADEPDEGDDGAAGALVPAK